MMRTLLLAASLAASPGIAAAAPTPLVDLRYDAGRHALVDARGGPAPTITGSVVEDRGPLGPAIRLDGSTTRITAPAWPRLTDGRPWTLSAWIRLDAWPWNEAPIVDQATSAGRLIFAIDTFGHLTAERRDAGGGALRIVSTAALQPRAWALVTLSYDGHALRLSLNGKPISAAAGTPQASEPADTSATPLLIGQTRTPELPYPTNAIHPLLPVPITLDARIARLTLDDGVLRPEELRARMAALPAAALQPAPATPLPRWRDGAGPFGAFRTTLAYDPSWDATRRIGPNEDVVVRFEGAPIQLVFWQGLNYIPAWVTENGRWYSDQFMEIYGKPRCPDGEDCEPMSDKQVRYSHVEILESSPARAVIHWRYALSEVENARLADAPDPADWGAWADEYWTVYPDGVATRRQVLWTDNPQREASEFQESIVIVPAGDRPEDDINLDALTLANLAGETKTYRWLQRTATGFAKPRGPDHFTGLADPMIQWINLKSAWKPFEVASAGPAKFEGINWEPSMASFEWWNHWPVAQIRSSGRPALTSDRPSHSSLSHIYWPLAEKDDHRLVRLLMTGLTQGSAGALAPRARAWVSPPAARLAGAATVRYDQAQRAFVVEGAAAGEPVHLTIDASADHPLVNPAVVVPGWHGTASATVEGAAAGAVRLGYVDRLEGRTLVAFLPLETSGPVSITLTPQP